MTHLVYVAGLEHSGTTLLTHLLSGFPKTIGLGEIFNLLNPTQLKNYHAAWGKDPEAYLCSCGQTWNECEFWGKVPNVQGDSCTASILQRYSGVIRLAESVFGNDVTLVDSSKNMEFLLALRSHLQKTRPDIALTVLHMIKDVRGFSISISQKSGSTQPSLLRILRSFNWWSGEVARTTALLKKASITSVTVLYDRLALTPEKTLKELGVKLSLDYDSYSTASKSSHIAIGNKLFTLHTINEIIYDTRWHFNNTVLLAYLMHTRARALNEKLHLQ